MVFRKYKLLAPPGLKEALMRDDFCVPDKFSFFKVQK
jgi:hypothetical protein